MWVLKFVFIPITALIALNMGLNYSGFCKAELRWLEDEEYIEAAALNSFKGYSRFPKTRIRYEFDHYQYQFRKVYNVIEYQSYDDFLTKNPECCNIVGDHWVQHSTAHLMPNIAAFVLVTYSVDRENPDIKNVDFAPVGNCGDVLRW